MGNSIRNRLSSASESANEYLSVPRALFRTLRVNLHRKRPVGAFMKLIDAVHLLAIIQMPFGDSNVSMGKTVRER